MVVPIKSAEGRIEGAVILEYTPLYEELRAGADETNRLLVGISVLCILLAIGLGVGIARTIANPMRKVVQVAESMAQGNFEQSITVTSRGEIGALQHAFNAMTKAVLATIRQQTAHLEEQVTTANNARAEADLARVEIAAQLSMIATQQTVIMEMSVPILPLAKTTLVMPLVGALDDSRLQLIQERALQAIAQSAARYLILDITGVPIVDTQVANKLLKLIQAARLIGSTVIIVGVRPEVAQTIVGLGIQLQDIVTRSTLQSGIAYTQNEQAPQFGSML